MKRKLFPVIIELIGITAIGAGIGIELATYADIGYVIITSGGWVVAIGGIIWGKFMRGEQGK